MAHQTPYPPLRFVPYLMPPAKNVEMTEQEAQELIAAIDRMERKLEIITVFLEEN